MLLPCFCYTRVMQDSGVMQDSNMLRVHLQTCVPHQAMQKLAEDRQIHQKAGKDLLTLTEGSLELSLRQWHMHLYELAELSGHCRISA